MILRRLVVVALCVASCPSFARADTRDLGSFRRSRGGGITVSVRSNESVNAMNGPSIMCFDQHVIESVHFYGLTRGELEQLRGLIDAALREAK